MSDRGELAPRRCAASRPGHGVLEAAAMSIWKDWVLHILIPLLIAGGVGAALGALLSSWTAPTGPR